MLTFLTLLIAHLIGDFVFQRNAVVAGKLNGLWIAWFEHLITHGALLSAFLAEAWAALGLVLAAKSVFRFGDLRKGRRHAEYFLIGTLLSVSQVVLLGALLKLILQHLSL